MADKYGRKRLALVFCVTYAVCCVIKLSSSFWVLMMGRLMGKKDIKKTFDHYNDFHRFSKFSTFFQILFV